MPRLLTSEIFLICFVISLWLISILVCLKRYSLFICFHKRDVPFYNSSLINVSTKIATEEYTNVNNSRPLSPLSPSSHHHFYQSWNENEIHKERECSACSISPSTNAILNKSVTQATNFNTVLTHDQSICKKCYKHKSPSDYKSLSNDYFNFKSNSCSIGKIHKNFSFNSNHVHIQRSSKYDQNKFYYSNGIIYPIKQNSSTLLSKVSTSPKNSKPQLKSKDSLSSKRALIRKNHFNLMSLDENALYKLNRVSHMNSTIHESSIDAPEIEPKESKTDNKRLSVLTSHTNPHANFISLRSGSDSANSSWIKPGRSYDGDNCDCNELDSSISLHQSQFLRLPSLNKLNTPILPTSQRPINPISSLRRHMFVNSRRCAQTTFDRNQTDSLSQDIVNSLSIASNNLSNIPAIDEINNNNKNSVQNINNVETVEAVNECKDPNLLNPSWIPLIVRRTLLEMHERAVLSKSDSNIKSKYRSSNHLLHSIKGNSKLKSSRKKKSLSLQNSQDKSNFYSTSNNRSSNGGSSYLNNFYEELRQRFFLLNSNEAKGNNQEKNKENFSNCTEQNLDIDKSCSKNSTSNSNTISTDLSTVVFRLDSKLNSLDRQLSSTNVDKCLNEISGEENNAEFFDDKKK
ncbi:unnamed protein product [Brachionus calyciflorus]|uniref:Uncharacterized protein n=1 Tax=Brachionus calyciflorus TaxID=104777 RepID=A0A813Z5I1_9BILA|nr:unnamed protein product [Brachionus calyciflorus]